MSLSDKNFKYQEANDFLVMLLYLRLLDKYRGKVKPMNVLLMGLPATGRIAAFNYNYEPLSHVNLSYMGGERYVVLPLIVMTNTIGETSAVLYEQYLDRDDDQTYDDYLDQMELDTGHLTALLIDYQLMKVYYIDANSFGLSFYMEPERVKIQHDANLRAIEEFLTTNAKLCGFEFMLETNSPTQDSTGLSYYQGLSVERINTLGFLAQTYQTMPENYDEHIGVCVPSTFLIVEWMIDGGAINQRLQILEEKGMPLHAFLLEYAKTTVEEYYTASVLGLTDVELDYNTVVSRPGNAYRWVRLLLNDHFVTN
jgi:hypothetical protein